MAMDVFMPFDHMKVLMKLFMWFVLLMGMGVAVGYVSVPVLMLVDDVMFVFVGDFATLFQGMVGAGGMLVRMGVNHVSVPVIMEMVADFTFAFAEFAFVAVHFSCSKAFRAFGCVSHIFLLCLHGYVKNTMQDEKCNICR